MSYLEFLNLLKGQAEEDFAVFQRRLIFTKYSFLGVRTPVMRRLAKSFKGNIEALLSYPDEYYEVVFIKLTAISLLPYEEFLRYIDYAVSKMDNWALCDCFKAKCIAKHKEEFLPQIEKFFIKGEEYSVRYALVTLLYYYVEKPYISKIKDYLRRTDTAAYYIHMAAAWLVAELLVKEFEEGVTLLKEGVLSPKTHNKAIQKAIESYRLTDERKEFLRSLKIK